MLIFLATLFPRILVFWGWHLILAVLGGLIMSINGLFQSRGASEFGAMVVLVLSLLSVILYFWVMRRISAKTLKSTTEGWEFAIGGTIPMILLILLALYFRSLTPYNTIRYGFTLVPVTLPFQGWIEAVYPALPFHILALSVPLVFIAGVVSGTTGKPNG